MTKSPQRIGMASECQGCVHGYSIGHPCHGVTQATYDAKVKGCSYRTVLTPQPEIDAPTRRAAKAWHWAHERPPNTSANEGRCPSYACESDLRFMGLSPLKLIERIVNMSKETGWDLSREPFGGSYRDPAPVFKPTPVKEVQREAEEIKQRRLTKHSTQGLGPLVEGRVVVAKAPESLPQGTKLDEGKPRWLLLMDGCKDALRGAVAVLMYGAQKGYKDHNWKRLPKAKDRITDSLYRHLDDLREGKELDEESGMPVIDHVLTNALFLSQLYHESKKK